MIRLSLLAAVGLALSGCYVHHTYGDTPDEDGGAPLECGDDTCGPLETCCELCEGETICVGDREPCPDVFCESECDSSFDCDDDEYCRSDTGSCGEGTCEPRPTGCFGDCPLVCGCDGLTYCNVCEASRAGTSVSHFGECEIAPGCVCGPGQYCEFGDRCFDNPFPVCAPVPTECSGIFAPVCGCNGVTYGNSCLAAADSMSVRFGGSCETDEDVRATCERLCPFARDFCGDTTENCVELCSATLVGCTPDELERARSCADTMSCMSGTACLEAIPCIPFMM
jgi:hypothetical protein